MATFFNQAILSYNNNVTNSNIVTGELLEVLSVTKTSLPANYRAGEDVTYIVSIVNSGPVAYTGLTLTDNLGEYELNTTPVTPLTYDDGTVRYYVNGVLQATPTVTAGPPLTVSGISVPANGNAMVVYSATANSFAPLGTGGNIVNTATLSGGGIAVPVSAENTVTANDEAALSITKSINPTSVVENGEITYTFVIQNLGSSEADAADNVTLTDTFDPILDITSVTFNVQAWASPANYTYNEATGEFATVPGQITVPAATFAQDPTTGVFVATPGVATLTVTGTV